MEIHFTNLKTRYSPRSFGYAKLDDYDKRKNFITPIAQSAIRILQEENPELSDKINRFDLKKFIEDMSRILSSRKNLEFLFLYSIEDSCTINQIRSLSHSAESNVLLEDLKKALENFEK